MIVFLLINESVAKRNVSYRILRAIETIRRLASRDWRRNVEKQNFMYLCNIELKMFF